MKKIYGFYNIAMINNYYDIFTKQMANLVDSGLLNKTDRTGKVVYKPCVDL